MLYERPPSTFMAYSTAQLIKCWPSQIAILPPSIP